MSNISHGKLCERKQIQLPAAVAAPAAAAAAPAPNPSHQSKQTMKFSDFGVDETAFGYYAGHIANVVEGVGAYIKMIGARRDAPMIWAAIESFVKEGRRPRLVHKGEVSFKLQLNRNTELWIASEAYIVKDEKETSGGEHQQPKSAQSSSAKYQPDDEYYEEEVAEGMSRRPKPRICRFFAHGKCGHGKLCKHRHDKNNSNGDRGEKDQRAEPEVEKRGRWADQENDESDWTVVTKKGLDWSNHDGKYDRTRWKPGDWLCHTCGDHQFARNRTCRKCGLRGLMTPKPEESRSGQGDRAKRSEESAGKQWILKKQSQTEEVLKFLCEECLTRPRDHCAVCDANTQSVKL